MPFWRCEPGAGLSGSGLAEDRRGRLLLLCVSVSASWERKLLRYGLHPPSESLLSIIGKEGDATNGRAAGGESRGCGRPPKNRSMSHSVGLHRPLDGGPPRHCRADLPIAFSAGGRALAHEVSGHTTCRTKGLFCSGILGIALIKTLRQSWKPEAPPRRGPVIPNPA